MPKEAAPSNKFPKYITSYANMNEQNFIDALRADVVTTVNELFHAVVPGGTVKATVGSLCSSCFVGTGAYYGQAREVIACKNVYFTDAKKYIEAGDFVLFATDPGTFNIRIQSISRIEDYIRG